MPKNVKETMTSLIEMMYKDGSTIAQIAKNTNISEPTIRKMIRDNGWVSPKNVLTEETKKDIKKLYCKDGYSTWTIAERLKVSKALVEGYVRGNDLKKNIKSKVNNEEFELNRIDALDHMRYQLLNQFKKDPYALELINNSDMEMLLFTAKKYFDEHGDEYSLEMDNEKVIKKNNKKVNDVYKVANYIKSRKDLIYDIVCEKIYNIIKDVIYGKFIRIPQPVFKGVAYEEWGDNGQSKLKWRRDFEVDLRDAEFTEIVRLMNESIKNGTKWDLEKYLQSKHPELYDCKDLYDIEYETADTRLLFDDIETLCVIYDLFMDKGIIEDVLELTEEEQILFNAYSNFELVYIKEAGGTKVYKNYKKLNIYKTLDEAFKSEDGRNIDTILNAVR